MLVDGPTYLTCPIHELRNMAASASMGTDRYTGRIMSGLEEPIQLAYTQALSSRRAVPDEQLEGALTSLQNILPTPEQRETELNDARIEPENWI